MPIHDLTVRCGVKRELTKAESSAYRELARAAAKLRRAQKRAEKRNRIRRDRRQGVARA